MGIPLPPSPPPGPDAPKYASRLHTGKVKKTRTNKQGAKNRRAD